MRDPLEDRPLRAEDVRALQEENRRLVAELAQLRSVPARTQRRAVRAARVIGYAMIGLGSVGAGFAAATGEYGHAILRLAVAVWIGVHLTLMNRKLQVDEVLAAEGYAAAVKNANERFFAVRGWQPWKLRLPRVGWGVALLTFALSFVGRQLGRPSARLEKINAEVSASFDEAVDIAKKNNAGWHTCVAELAKTTEVLRECHTDRMRCYADRDQLMAIAQFAGQHIKAIRPADGGAP